MNNSCYLAATLYLHFIRLRNVVDGHPRPRRVHRLGSASHPSIIHVRYPIIEGTTERGNEGRGD